MKTLINTFFILSLFGLNAQIEQTEPIIETPAKFECNQTVKGEVRDKITADLLLDAIVVLSDKDGDIIETQRVKEDATFSFKVKCETTYKLEGRKVDFTAESKDFTTSDEEDKELKLLISLGKGNIDFVTDAKTDKTEGDVIKEEKLEETKPEKIPDPLPKETIEQTIKINPIYFDLASSYLSKKAKGQLQKTVDLMNKYPKMIVELSSHSDAQGSDKINNWFSDRRAKRTLDYLIKKGINSNRITSKGYGATQLVNHCNTNVECTDEQHAKNRRTEFVIIKM